MSQLRTYAAILLTLACATLASAAPVSQHDVIPILSRRCVMCHGQTLKEGGVDLRTKTSMLASKAFVLGKPEESPLIKRITTRACPPDKNISMAGIERMSARELQKLKDWIAAKAPEVEQELAPEKVDPDARKHWAYQPIRHPKIPALDSQAATRNPIDAFLLRKLRAEKLAFSALADKATLLRRVTFDLTGLPPTVAELEAFFKDTSSIAYDKVVDRLLASPRYGERWGRHWLDLAGYADSEGKRNADMVRPYAWKYRDYVIRAFNDDKPYNEFLIEQIAGDELVDYADAAKVDANVIEKLVATGFLRMAPDGTSANPVNRVEDRLEVIGDELQILAGGVLGLTLECAKCHDHKYDPISQRDYYSFAAIFKAAYDEYNWLTPQPFRNQWAGSSRRHLAVAMPAERAEVEAHNAKVEKELEPLRKKHKAAKGKEKKDLKKQLDELEAKKKELPQIRALWDRGEASPTYVNLRGNVGSPGPLVTAALPRVFSETAFQPAEPVGKNKTGNRLALARWIASADNPLTARVWVNRVWKHHFGRGLVTSLDNFGKLGTPPTHPELLDWLASELIKNDWSTKHLHRLMVTSTAYRQKSLNPQSAPRDPKLNRMPMRRMDAEEVHDSLLAIAGKLDLRMGGNFDEVQVRADGHVMGKPGEKGWRRSVYIRQRRKHIPTVLETFDLPAMNPNCVQRINSTVVSQPLYLLHSRHVHDLSRHVATRLQKETQGNAPRLRRAFLTIINRPPTATEQQHLLEALVNFERQYEKEKVDGHKHKALADICHALFNSASFLYID